MISERFTLLLLLVSVMLFHVKRGTGKIHQSNVIPVLKVRSHVTATLKRVGHLAYDA